jgi:DNA polymerase
MSDPQASTHIAAALKCRFESDALLGARVLPITIPQPQAEIRGPTPVTGLVVPAVQPLPARPPIDSAELEERRVQLELIDDGEVKGCQKCGLAGTRTKTVYGVGSPAARILFVGEAPGHDEDVSGEPFVGRAGRLLTDMIEKGMGLRREDVYICNVLKCRPPNNRTPASDEIASCKDYLLRQIEIIRPELIIALGAPAAQTLLGTKEGIGRLRGRFHDFYPSGSSMIGVPIPLLPTFHPAYLLRSPGEKVKAWADLKLAMAKLGIPLPKRG